MRKPRPTLALLCLSLIAAPAIKGQSRRPLRPPPSRSYVQESISTKFGILKLIRIEDSWIGETNWLVALNKKMIYRTQDDVFGSVSVHTIFKAASLGEIVLLQENFGTMEDCVQFRLIDLRAIGKPTITDRFGNCSPAPVVTQKGEIISFEFSPKSGLKADAWVYQSGELSQTSTSK